jgi:hypothetical protein
MVSMGMRSSWVLVAGLAFVGCDKGPSASGKLEENEASLLKRLPASGDLVFGGNVMKFQAELAKSPLAKLSSKMAAVAEPGLGAWQDCLGAEKIDKMLGTVDASKGISLRYVMTGIGIAQLEKCATAAKFDVKKDADGKFVSITMPGFENATMGFLAVDGGVYGRQFLDVFGGKADIVKLHRASFEADLEVAKQDNAGGNNKLVKTLELADRSKSMWFAGSAAKTPLGDKVKDVWGFVDLDGGVHVDVTVEMTDAQTADEILSGFSKAKEMASFVGADFKKVVDAVKLERKETQLHLTVKVTNAQIQKMMDQLGPLMNMGLGGMGGGRKRDKLDDFQF